MNPAKFHFFLFILLSLNVQAMRKIQKGGPRIKTMDPRVFHEKFQILNDLGKSLNSIPEDTEKELAIIKTEMEAIYTEIENLAAEVIIEAEKIKPPEAKNPKYNHEIKSILSKSKEILALTIEPDESEISFLIRLRDRKILLLYYQLNLIEWLKKLNREQNKKQEDSPKL